MRILFDNGVPRPVASALQAHVVEEARARGWDSLANGELLTAAEAAGFEVMVTTDRNLASQQNLSGRRIALVVLTTPAWPSIRPRLSAIASAVDAATPGTYVEVDVPILRR
ncbi:MAG: hypothetical protein KA385_10650 [Vicinamibacteria bacterium]|nr:hypothetical protein [Vicinamibacteria bacterium]